MSKSNLQLIRVPVIQFDDVSGRYYDTPEGRFPSVTTVLKSIANAGLEEWRKRVGPGNAAAISAEARARGSRLHHLVERFLDTGHCDGNNCVDDLVVWDHFYQLKSILEKLEVVALEIPVYSASLRMAGRCDCVAFVNGLLHVVDFKTSKSEKAPDRVHSYRLQATAYAHMLNEMYALGIKRYVIMIANLDTNKPSFFTGYIEEYLTELITVRSHFDTQGSSHEGS